LCRANNVDTIGAVNGGRIEMGAVEEDPAKVIGEHDVGVQVDAPAVILEVIHAGVDRCAFVEIAAVLSEQVGLDANGPMLFGNELRFAIVVRGDDDERVQVRMVESQSDIEKVVEADGHCDCLEAERFELIHVRRRIGGVVHRPRNFSRSRSRWSQPPRNFLFWGITGGYGSEARIALADEIAEKIGGVDLVKRVGGRDRARAHVSIHNQVGACDGIKGDLKPASGVAAVYPHVELSYGDTFGKRFDAVLLPLVKIDIDRAIAREIADIHARVGCGIDAVFG
jgi:hypothetical protein